MSQRVTETNSVKNVFVFQPNTNESEFSVQKYYAKSSGFPLPSLFLSYKCSEEILFSINQYYYMLIPS